ncbi:XRE family transcriptional regulator [Streptomyces venezuelae]|uniref:XRE family transcriptional regulator n=1 Tax=Streptomyces venezuelae TaxID=54571 RepID=A0A5P2CL96_STRVZ|nr:helix-turn-helix transcriptional regulator [Streptomyces venezuelae]QES43070.1 XRE family transcriptional regulator [Streptomyces venezuelae]
MALRQHITERQRRLGVELRKLRENAGLNLIEAAALIGVGRPHMTHIEAARTGISTERIHTLATRYGCTSGTYIDELVRLSESNGKGWWSEYRKELPQQLLDLAELEDRATSIASYETLLIPGLLQTESYMRTLFQNARPSARPAEIDTLVRFRLARQRILTGEHPPHLHAVIHEAALRMVVGNPQVMRNQLAHLIRSSNNPHVTIQVLSFDQGTQAWRSAPFLLLSPGVPGLETVFVEHPAAGMTLHDSEAISQYRATIAALGASALAPIVNESTPDRLEDRDSLGLVQHIHYAHSGARR